MPIEYYALLLIFVIPVLFKLASNKKHDKDQ